MRASRIIHALMLLLLVASCGRPDKGDNGEDTDRGDAASPFSYEEGDTLRLQPGQAPNLTEWMRFHSKADSAWKTSRFIASGVNIHIDSMDAAPPLSDDRMRAFGTLFSWSPDSSRCIDIWSYNRLMETENDGSSSMVGGGPDQMVALSDRSGKRRLQVMFNGPMQMAETADWISSDAFLLGMVNIDESEGTFVPEILLFNLVDTVYTNFRYPDTLSLDRLPGGEGGFVADWLKGRGVRQR